MATIPNNQKKMHSLIDELMMPELFPRSTMQICADLRACVMDLSRKPRATNAPPVSRPITPEIRKQIRQLHRDNPMMTQQEIAVVFGVGAGRVSEALAGFRR